MLGLYLTVPVACFRKGLAREYLETESLPPPATCYGFLLSLVGEVRRERHIGCRVAPGMLNRPAQSVVLRTVWRCKDKNYWIDPTGRHHVVPATKKERAAFVKWVREKGWPEPEFVVGLGAGTNARPDYQQLLTGVEALIWLDSTDEPAERGSGLEARVRQALTEPASVQRFGGLSLGESTHLVDEVCVLEDRLAQRLAQRSGVAEVFLTHDRGRLTMPVWVDHVGSSGTKYVTGDLVAGPLLPPDVERMPRIERKV